MLPREGAQDEQRGEGTLSRFPIIWGLRDRPHSLSLALYVALPSSMKAEVTVKQTGGLTRKFQRVIMGFISPKTLTVQRCRAHEGVHIKSGDAALQSRQLSSGTKGRGSRRERGGEKVGRREGRKG